MRSKRAKATSGATDLPRRAETRRDRIRRGRNYRPPVSGAEEIRRAEERLAFTSRATRDLIAARDAERSTVLYGGEIRRVSYPATTGVRPTFTSGATPIGPTGLPPGAPRRSTIRRGGTLGVSADPYGFLVRIRAERSTLPAVATERRDGRTIRVGRGETFESPGARRI